MDRLQILEDQFGRERKQIARRHARHPDGLPEVERAALVKQLQGQMALWAESGGDGHVSGRPLPGGKPFPLARELEKLMTPPDGETVQEGKPDTEDATTDDPPDTGGPIDTASDTSGDESTDTTGDDTTDTTGDGPEKGKGKSRR